MKRFRNEVKMRLMALAVVTMALVACRTTPTATPQADRAPRQAAEPAVETPTLEQQVEALREQVAELTQRAEAAELEAKQRADLAEIYRRLFREVITGARWDEKKENETITTELLYRKAHGKFKSADVTRRHPLAQAAAAETMASLSSTNDELDMAERYYRKALETLLEHRGEDHPDTLRIMDRLGTVIAEQGRWREAIEIKSAGLERTLAQPDRIKDRSSVRSSISWLVDILMLDHQWERAEQWTRREIELISSGSRRRESYIRSATNRCLIPALQHLGRYEEAERETRALLAEYASEDLDSTETLEATCRLAWLLHLQGRDEEAALIDESIDQTTTFLEQIERPCDSTIFAEYMIFRQRYETALRSLERAITPGGFRLTDPFHLQPAYRLLVAVYEATGQEDKADEVRPRLLDAKMWRRRKK